MLPRFKDNSESGWVVIDAGTEVSQLCSCLPVQCVVDYLVICCFPLCFALYILAG